MDSIVGFLFGRLFYIDLFLIAFIELYRFPRKSRYPLRLLCALGAVTALSFLWSCIFESVGNSSILLMIVNYLGMAVMVMTAMAFCYETTLWKTLYMAAAIWFTQHAANCIDFGFFPGGGVSFYSFCRHSLLMLFCALVVYLAFCRRIDSVVLERLQIPSVMLVWFLMAFVCVGLNSYAILNDFSNKAFYLTDLAFNIIGLIYQENLYRYVGLARENESVLQLLEQSRKQYETAKSNVELVNIKSHDLRHQINHFRKAGTLDEKLLADMEQVINDYDTSVHTGNDALDVILTEKSMLCSSRRIGFTCMADGSGLSHVEPADLYALFGNALENAMEAVEALADDPRRQIALTVRRADRLVSVHLQNYTDGKLTLVDGLPRTSKSDLRNHGFGVKSMRLLTEKYGGEMAFTQEADVVNLYIMFPIP